MHMEVLQIATANLLKSAMDSCYKFLFTRFITAHNLLIIQCSTQYAQYTV